MDWALGDVLAFSERLRPVLVAPFLSMVAESQRRLAAGVALADAIAEVRAATRTQRLTQRDLLTELLGHVVCEFMEGRRDVVG